MLLGTWPTFFFSFLTDMYLYNHMTSTHMIAYLYNRAIFVKASTGLDSTTCTKSELVASTLKIVEVSNIVRDDFEKLM